MPKKADKRKGRRTRNIGQGNSAPTTSQQSNGSNKRSPTPRGRTTRNSQRGRKPPRPAPPKRTNGRGRKLKKDSTHSTEQPIFFTSESGKQYKPGGESYITPPSSFWWCYSCVFTSLFTFFTVIFLLFMSSDFAYVDSQQPDLPYHICRILSFKMVRMRKRV